MKKNDFKLVLIMVFILMFKVVVFSATPIMPLSDVRPGMRAICKTIFQGTNVEDFELEIVDIIQNFTPKNDLFLVRLLSPKALETGVVSGMSGSPVYIDGKLIGALAMRFGLFTKEPIGGVMPIEQMMAIFEKENVRGKERSIVGSESEFPIHLAVQAFDDPAPVEAAIIQMFKSGFPVLPASYGLTPIQIPLKVTGFDSKAISKFEHLFKGIGFQLVQGSSATGATNADSLTSYPIVPGGAISGVLADGDIGFSALGTITHTDGNKLLAFGHPFFGSGPVNIPMASAKILMTVSSTYSSYKMSQDGSIVGSIHQDRSSGIMGVIGDTPEMIPVNLKYESPFQEKFEYNFRIAKDKSLNFLTPLILWTSLLNALSSARMGDGNFNTTMSGRIVLSDYDDIVFNNLYSGGEGGADISNSTLEVAIASAALLTNKFAVPKIEKIEVNCRSKLGIKSAKIERVWYDKSRVKPGETVVLNIFIRPNYQPVQKLTHTLKIPEKLEPGLYSIVIGGARYISMMERSFSPGKFRPYDLKHLIRLLNQKRKNDKLCIHLRKIQPGMMVNDQEFSGLPPSILRIMNSKQTSSKAGMLRDRLVLEQSKPMEWVVTGGQWIRIQVVKD